MVEEWCHDSVGECGVCASVPFGLRCWDMLLVLVLHVKDACGSVCVCVCYVGGWWVSGGPVVGQWAWWCEVWRWLVSCWAEACAMRQGWVQWVGVQWAAVVVWE